MLLTIHLYTLTSQCCSPRTLHSVKAVEGLRHPVIVSTHMQAKKSQALCRLVMCDQPLASQRSENLNSTTCSIPCSKTFVAKGSTPTGWQAGVSCAVCVKAQNLFCCFSWHEWKGQMALEAKASTFCSCPSRLRAACIKCTTWSVTLQMLSPACLHSSRGCFPLGPAQPALSRLRLVLPRHQRQLH